MKINLNDFGTKDIKTFIPTKFEDAEQIVKYLKDNPLILNLSKLKGNKAQRFLDILLGACLLIDKGVCPLDKDNYLFLDKNN